MDEQLKTFTVKIDQTTINFLSDEVRKKRAAGAANAFSDIFLIRLTEALNKNADSAVFKVKRPAAK